MPQHYIKTLAPLLLITSLTIGSIYYFYTYQPKKLTAITEVKGVRTTKIDDLPLPPESSLIASSKSTSASQTTFRSNTSTDDIEIFYKTILLEKGWIIDTEFITQDALVSKYKKGDYLISVTASQAKNQPSIGSLEISTR